MEKYRTHACVRVPEHILGSIAVDEAMKNRSKSMLIIPQP